MSDRSALIARKENVRQQIEWTRRELAREEAHGPPSARRTQQLQEQLERLMAEEFNLRLAIDRSPINQNSV